MSALTRPTRFAPPKGDDVPWHRISKGDWAYTSGYWWKVLGLYSSDQIMVKLERPGMEAEVIAAHVQRWRLALEHRV